MREAEKHEPRVDAFFVDIPLCTTTALPDYNRGYVESYVHYEPRGMTHESPLVDFEERTTGPDNTLVQIRRKDLDDAERKKRPECMTCRYEPVCEGVWSNYLRRYGWDEFTPVPRD